MRSKLLLTLSFLLPAGCTPASDPATSFSVLDAGSANADVTHPHFPLIAGHTLRYRGSEQSSESSLTTTRHVSHFPCRVGGIECRVVIERVLCEECILEERLEYYTQDAQGNVWLLGVDRTEYDPGGAPISKQGSWRFDEAGQTPGMFLPRNLAAGDTFTRRIQGDVIHSQVLATQAGLELDEFGYLQPCLHLVESAGASAEDSRARFFARGIGDVLLQGSGSRRALIRIHDDRNPDIRDLEFTAEVDHVLHPLPPGRTLLYSAETGDGWEEVVVEVLSRKTRIMGIECTTVHERSYVNGALSGDAFKWYAQDSGGTVWFFGEDKHIDIVESWQAGIDGAQPGVAMLALPRVGDSYRHEYAPGIAESIAQVRSHSVTVETGLGPLEALEILVSDELEEPDGELEYYAPHLGLVVEMNEDGSEYLPLVEVIDRSSTFADQPN